MTFDLHDLVKQVCATSALTHPKDLAKEVLGQIDEHDEHDALEQSLATVVQKYVSRDHRPLITPGDQGRGDTQTGTVAGGSNRSPYVTALRSAWQRQLTARVNVGVGDWKRFGDCTAEDLDFMSRHRRELAAANIASADKLDTIAALLEEHGVDMVRDIPEHIVAELKDAA